MKKITIEIKDDCVTPQRAIFMAKGCIDESTERAKRSNHNKFNEEKNCRIQITTDKHAFISQGKSFYMSVFYN